MANETVVTATLLVLYYISCSQGIELVFDRDIQVATEARIPCGVLHCVENVSPTSSVSDRTDAGSISNMTIFKKLPITSKEIDNEHKHGTLVASLTSDRPNVTQVTNGVKVSAILSSNRASMRLEMFKRDDCRADYTCQAEGLDSQGRTFLTTTTLMQQNQEDLGGNLVNDGNIALATSQQLLVQQLDAKLALVMTSLRQVEDRIEEKILSFERRLVDKIASATTDVRNQVQALDNISFERRLEDKLNALENRMEDKIANQVETLSRLDAKLSAMNKDYVQFGNPSTLLEKLSAFKCRLKREQQNSFSLVLEKIDARISSSAKQIVSNLTESVTEIISPDNDTFLASLAKMSSSQQVSFEAINKLEASMYDITNKTQSVLGGMLDQIEITKMQDFKSLIMSILSPSTCKKGMVLPLSQYPFPHPVIYTDGESGLKVAFLCDTLTDGGGWIIIQRRSTGNVDFYRDWATYKNGFGSLDDEFWLGNERIHTLTSNGTWELRVDLKYKGKSAFAHYSEFSIENEKSKYTLRIGQYNGNAGNSLEYHKGKPFTTFDRDNDDTSSENCAETQIGGWWYGACDTADLNSKWNGGADRGLEWNALTASSSASFSEMKIRRLG
ncbi:fibrinogen related protein 12.1 [Plakobranchus ocellatus]|uniref:Fibrinogen related protein 12.1 n=1 Tax=Plakobranchus ocellatus TaxID=259542 RepID=A0AAV4C579_9GAST|nr:fibrinogen related protein 12.1 [Plakobranchus ocellatus]